MTYILIDWSVDWLISAFEHKFEAGYTFPILLFDCKIVFLSPMFNIGTKNLFLSHLNIPFKGKSRLEFINALFSLHLKNPIFAFILVNTSTNVNVFLGSTFLCTVSTENAVSSTSIQLGLGSGQLMARLPQSIYSPAINLLVIMTNLDLSVMHMHLERRSATMRCWTSWSGTSRAPMYHYWVWIRSTSSWKEPESHSADSPASPKLRAGLWRERVRTIDILLPWIYWICAGYLYQLSIRWRKIRN